MHTHVDKPQEKENHSEPDNGISQKGVGKLSPGFVDNRPEAILQAKLQDMVHNSLQVRQLRAFQDRLQHRMSTQQPVQRQTKANNTGLPDGLKAGIENLSGHSMNDVKVHYNSDKPAQLQAHAYAQGTDIHLASGQEKHLPHEAWHVVQQKQGRVKPTIQMKAPLLSSGHLIQRSVIQRSLAPKDAQKLENIFVKWVVKHVRSVFTPYFFSELEGALIAFYNYQDAYNYLQNVVESHETFVGTFQNATLGERIGRGSEKDVYTLVGHPGIVIGISKSTDLEGAILRMRDETALLNRLRVEAGIPVAEIIGIIEYHGRAATLMYAYAEGSKSTVTNDKQRFNEPVRVGNSANLNATSIEDLNEIMVKFQRKKVRIDDIQFLIGSDGSVVVADPLSLEMGTHPPTTNMIRMIHRLVETAAENEMYKLLQNDRRSFTADELAGRIEGLGVDPHLIGNVLRGLRTNYSTMIKWNESTDTYRYSSVDEVD